MRMEGGERFVSREGLWAAVREGRVNIDSRLAFVGSFQVTTVREILKAEGERGGGKGGGAGGREEREGGGQG